MILSGWKEIAQYLHCGLRTAQRRQSVGLPVRRSYSGHRAPVFAYSEEIDEWLHGGSFWRKKDVDKLAHITRSRELRAQVRQSREKLRRTVTTLEKTLDTHRAKLDAHRAKLDTHRAKKD